jgi:hypothetical protein
MYSIELRSVKICFASALISVPRDGSDYDWINDEWVDIAQQIEIVQAGESATVYGLTGYGAEKGCHVIQVIDPPIYTEYELLEHLLKGAAVTKLPRETLLPAVAFASYPWGKLISLNWKTIGYAPGGVEHYMLPSDGSAIHLGFLRLNWPSVQIYATA